MVKRLAVVIQFDSATKHKETSYDMQMAEQVDAAMVQRLALRVNTFQVGEAKGSSPSKQSRYRLMQGANPYLHKIEYLSAYLQTNLSIIGINYLLYNLEIITMNKENMKNWG